MREHYAFPFSARERPGLELHALFALFAGFALLSLYAGVESGREE